MDFLAQCPAHLLPGKENYFHAKATRAQFCHDSWHRRQAPAVPISYTWHSYSLAANAIGGVTCFVTCSPPPNTGFDQTIRTEGTTFYDTAHVFSDQAVASNIWYLEVPPFSGISGQAASVAIGGEVSFGVMRALLLSGAGSSVYQFVIDGSGTYTNPGGASASGAAEQGWADQITIESDTLSPGTDVDVRITWELDSLVGGEIVGSCGPASAPYVRMVGSTGLGGSFDVAHTPCNGTDLMAETHVLHTHVGDSFGVSAGLNYITGPCVGIFCSVPNGTEISQFVDVGNTSYFLFEVLTPGVTYSAASGTRFLTEIPSQDPGVSVPLPASGLLLAVGMAGFLAWRRSIS